MSKQGYIKLYRQLQDCWIWEDKPYDRARAWIDILLSCNHADKKITFDGEPYVVERGQWLTSIVKLSDRWGWSRKKVSHFLDVLEVDQMIVLKKSNKCTVIKVLNYEVYQGIDCEKEQQKSSRRAAKEQQKSTNNNDNNDKNDKYIYYPNDEALNNAFDEYVEHRKRMKKPVDQYKAEGVIKKLDKLSGGDSKTAIAILRQSIDERWIGLFELKQNTGKKNDPNKGIQQRDYDVDEIERKLLGL